MEINHLRSRSAIAVSAAVLSASAHALAQRNNCTADPSAASCGLDSTAHLLRIAAVILGLILFVTLLASVAIYQRNKTRKLTPDE